MSIETLYSNSKQNSAIDSFMYPLAMRNSEFRYLQILTCFIKFDMVNVDRSI